jgi:parallel beta-helix repeat protein
VQADGNDHDVIIEGVNTDGNRIEDGLVFADLSIRDGASNTTVRNTSFYNDMSTTLTTPLIWIQGATTRDVSLLNVQSFVAFPDSAPRVRDTVRIEEAEGVLIGGNEPTTSLNRRGLLAPPGAVGLHLIGAKQVRVTNTIFYGEGVGAFIEGNSRNILIGSDDPTDGVNRFSADLEMGIHATASTDLQILNNQMTDALYTWYGPTDRGTPRRRAGILLDGGVQRCAIQGNTIQGCLEDGIHISDATTTGNLVKENTIFANNRYGVYVLNGARRNAIRGNSIYLNGARGIALEAGGNNQLPPPVLGSWDAKEQVLSGTIPDTVSVGSTIEVFADAEDEGQMFLGLIPVRPERTFRFRPWQPLPLGMNLTATVTDPQGNTSEFGNPLLSPTARPAAFFVLTTTRFGNREILRLFPGEATGTRLTYHPGVDQSPILSPNPHRVAFVSDRSGNLDVWVMTSSGTGARNLTNHAADDFDPAWSPDGKKIAFVSTRDGNPEIFVMDADGRNVQQLTQTGTDVVHRHPTWSSDGTKMAFARGPANPQAGGNWEIFVINANGGSEGNLTNHPANDDRPAWSPDGRDIAFVSDRDGNPEIYLMKSDGSDVRRLTDDGAVDTDPAWLPDGQRLLFTSDRQRDFEIYVMRTDGSGVQRLTVSLGINIQPNAGQQ